MTNLIITGMAVLMEVYLGLGMPLVKAESTQAPCSITAFLWVSSMVFMMILIPSFCMMLSLNPGLSVAILPSPHRACSVMFSLFLVITCKKACRPCLSMMD